MNITADVVRQGSFNVLIAQLEAGWGCLGHLQHEDQQRAFEGVVGFQEKMGELAQGDLLLNRYIKYLSDMRVLEGILPVSDAQRVQGQAAHAALTIMPTINIMYALGEPKDTTNDSLLEDPTIRQFISLSHRLSTNKIPHNAHTPLSYRSLNPQIPQQVQFGRRKIILQSPSYTRVSFFTKLGSSRQGAQMGEKPMLKRRNSLVENSKFTNAQKTSLNKCQEIQTRDPRMPNIRDTRMSNIRDTRMSKIFLCDYVSTQEPNALSPVKRASLNSSALRRSPGMSRKLSSSVLKPKSIVEKSEAVRNKYFLEDPFRESLRESDYVGKGVE